MPALFRSVVALLALLLVAPAALADTPAPVPADIADGAIVWSPDAAFTAAALELRGPNGLQLRRAFVTGDAVAFAPAGLDAPDGIYVYSLAVVMDEGRSGVTQTGAFEVQAGAAVYSEMMDQVILDDLIVDGSLCVGLDCVNGESFGFDTVRLKENNVRIHFDDTSSTGSFPSNDWAITINDSNNGGASYFEVTDRTAGRSPFRIEATAPNWSLLVDDAGNVGFGTQTPVVELHAADGDTPTLRLEQNGSSGFTPQTWDLASNETNFFIRDVTNSSRLPFRIRPGAVTSSLDIQSDGDVVMAKNLYVGYANGNVTTAAGNTIFEVNGDSDNDGTADRIARFRAETRYDEQAEYRKDIFMRGSYTTLGITEVIKVTNLDSSTNLMILDDNGNLTISGAYTPTSDVNVKENILPVDPDAILEGVLSLPIATWEYIADTNDSTHLGPMAQDFARAFGLGMNDTTIATVDADGVALASIQALAARAEADRARVAELEAENEALRARLDRIEALLTARD